MTATEETIVYFFTDTVENGNVCVQILSCPVCLCRFDATIKYAVDGGQKVGRCYIVGVHDDHNVVCVPINGIHC